MADPFRPRPAINGDNAFFFDSLRDGRVSIQGCYECGELRHPPVPMCPQCHSLEWSPREMRGDGELVSFVVMHHPIVPPFEPGYIVAVVELTEGPRVVANLEGVVESDVEIGMPVRVVTHDVDKDLSLLVATAAPRRD